MAETNNEKNELLKRLENPSKEFDSLLWRPRSRFFRRLKARYVSYIVYLGYGFLALLLGAAVYVWVWPNPVYVESEGDGSKLEPLVEKVMSPGSGLLSAVAVEPGRPVAVGDRLATITAPDGSSMDVTAPIEGIAYPGAKNSEVPVVPGTAVDSGRVLFRVVDFTRFALSAVKVKKSAYDSVNIGDSAIISIEGNTLTDLRLSLAFDVEDEEVFGRVGHGLNDSLLEAIAKGFEGHSISADGFAEFPFSEISKAELNIYGKAKSVSQASGFTFRPVNFPLNEASGGGYGGPEFVLNRRKGATSVAAVVVGGNRVLKVTKIANYSPETRRAVEEFVGNRLGGSLVFADGKAYRLENMDESYLLETTVVGRIPLDQYDPSQIGRSKLERDTRSDDYMEVDLLVENPPQWVSAQARALFERREPAMLEGRVRIHAFNTTWGAKIRSRL